jgi:hypothetical protein
MLDNSNDVGEILEHQTNSTWRSLVYQDTVIVTFKDAALSVTKIPTTFKLIDLSNNSFDGSIRVQLEGLFHFTDLTCRTITSQDKFHHNFIT